MYYEERQSKKNLVRSASKYFFNRPGVAGAVLQTPMSLIHSLIN